MILNENLNIHRLTNNTFTWNWNRYWAWLRNRNRYTLEIKFKGSLLDQLFVYKEEIHLLELDLMGLELELGLDV